jgi:hypothetical protein
MNLAGRGISGGKTGQGKEPELMATSALIRGYLETTHLAKRVGENQAIEVNITRVIS